ncbi:hypothetical protein RND71_043700 [Anisodus tanguticus]|uniref:Sin3 C-terminal domain-containing protein n=1 Tax=Anisodus tanguticus TaxID=243964 RepID=A0AAE1QNY2_9SOLA|nr:hypothetical protein RND71_043700 [Anisodus tanguticus]
MIKKEEKSEITVPTANSNINSGSNANPISVSVPFPVLGQQSSSNQTIPGSQISGQQASVISMSWTSSVQHNSNSGLPINQSLRNNMPVNTIQNSHTVLSAPSVHLATVPATISTRQPTTQIRPNIGIIQDSRSHHTTTPHSSANNHSLHHISSNIHHVTGSIQNTSTQPQLNQQTTSNQHSTPQSQQPQYQRLKVEDALSYLDQVKFQFNSQPQVYNDFLDIMKEFKSQSIDTPGVIQRVSNLFRGHPELIVGFNTFLPPGYKIEMQANDQVNVSMPNRTTSAIIINGPPTTLSGTVPVVSTQTTLSNNVQQTTVSLNSTSASNNNRPINFGANALHAAISNVSSNNQLRASSNSSLDLNSTANLNSSNNSVTSTNGTTSTLSQPVEFNHAITYVNKIKNRFQAQPEVYKQFLEILHAYQKEQKIIKEGKTPDSKPLTESEVYLKVAKLFQNQDDLLQEFGQFLPESNSSTINNSTMFGQSTIGGQHYSSFINCSSSSNSVIDRSLGNLANSSISTVHSAAQHVDGLSRTTNDHGTIVKRPIIRGSTNSNLNSVNVTNVSSLHSKRQVPTNNFNQNMHSPNKKPKMTSLRDVSFAEASKYASLNEYSFFDKVRKALKTEYEVENYFAGLIDMVKQLLDGNLDSNQYEDQLREMFGIHAYISFTLDKVVQNIVRQLQHIVCDEGSVQSTELFLEASKFNATGGPCSTAFLRVAQEYSYQKKAESVLSEENIFKTIIYKEEAIEPNNEIVNAETWIEA